MGLNTLPYDLLLNIAAYLDVYDIHVLHLTSRTLYDFSTTRPVYRKLATDLLRRCRALPLKGFQRLTDLTTEQLIRSVNKATRYEVAWLQRAPMPLSSTPGPYPGFQSNYMDNADAIVTKSDWDCDESDDGVSSKKWYKVVSAPPGEDVDWLSPITSSYTLCATKSGKVVCWDVQTDKCLAEWNPGGGWELWKCRVEFEERTVFFTMARILTHSYDDERVMEFVLMRLTFSDSPSGARSPDAPIFSRVTDFKTTGVVMNVFLLDPSARLLSAFIWVASANTIGLYALLDWDKQEYVFIDTGIECLISSNWSCILYDGHIVVHCEESDSAFQHFYPLSMLALYAQPYATTDGVPVVSRRVAPYRTLSKKFVFPRLTHREVYHNEDETESEPEDEDSQPITFTTRGVTELTATTSGHEVADTLDSDHALSMTEPGIDETTTLTLGMESTDDIRRFKYSVPIGPSTSNSAEAESSSSSAAVLSRHYPPSTLSTYASSSTLSSSSGSPSTSTSTSAPSSSSSLNPPLTVVSYGEGTSSVLAYAYSPPALEPGILHPHHDFHGHIDLEHATFKESLTTKLSSPLTPIWESPNPADITTPLSPRDTLDDHLSAPPGIFSSSGSSLPPVPSSSTRIDCPALDDAAVRCPASPPFASAHIDHLIQSEIIATISSPSETLSTPSAPQIQPLPLPPQPQPQPPAHVPPPTTATTINTPQPNPFPFPPWYPENAHFVRQWWPSLPGIPRVSCTVVLLTMHDQETHSTKYVLAQHYFRVPISRVEWRKGEEGELEGMVVLEGGSGLGKKEGEVIGTVGATGPEKGEGGSRHEPSPGPGVSRSRGRSHSESYDGEDEDEGAGPSTSRRKKIHGKAREKVKFMRRRRRQRNMASSHGDAEMSSSYESDAMLDSEEEEVASDEDYSIGGDEEREELDSDSAVEASDNALMHLWYVSRPFEVVCVFDAGSDEEEEWAAGERPRPLVAVDFGHAVWIESVDPRHKMNEEKEWEKERMTVGVRKGMKKTSKTFESVYDDGDSSDAGVMDNRERWLRFVTFPPFSETGLREGHETRTRGMEKKRDWKGKGRSMESPDAFDEDLEGSPAQLRERERVAEVQRCEGKVRTLDIPEELDLDTVETINIDQSQGAVILSTREGKIFILCYE
ncbi:hypothetical protein BDN72DRAFT_847371 [Pluteus cervinus]|uniref:Uncharacterized protein n=1 Tax=Pluteus cervinus TaxID=181527 RepID=A0ACD3AD53_9AGAR|nr:hypothetical protein BDN72DRAFT_847371 [Pluteus cervinus]